MSVYQRNRLPTWHLETGKPQQRTHHQVASSFVIQQQRNHQTVDAARAWHHDAFFVGCAGVFEAR